MTVPAPHSATTGSNQDRAFRLDGRHALVTGGASGIGEATVKELVRAGAFVWIADINVTAAEALADSVGSSKALHLDVTSPESIAAASAKLDRLDILVNNAGIGHVGSIETTEPEDFDRLINVNVRSVYLVTRAFLPFLFAASQYHEAVGNIVNIGSVAGMVGIKQRFTYCMTKGAVLCASTPSAPAPCKRHSSRATSKNSTSTTRKRCVPNSAPGSPWAAWGSLRRSHPWSAILPLTKPLSSAAPASPSTAAGPPRNTERTIAVLIPHSGELYETCFVFQSRRQDPPRIAD